ncbi:hypothetical protein [Encephalitozoon cuniculi GB-M1]|uniref:Uncharacterized protein n=1 Tax=Encephalitozoon cuniculi (strain GB-M1) TaxID=284813 RepID=Q8SV61_ENCCU|nr:uncharacterized protein ECU06_1640 [Encephalitozoon cuniculi GB-M1]CAD25525.1 hypothetical protein [Encephalitozoon cuniculi GB-M1]
MEQISRIKIALGEVDLNYFKRAFTDGKGGLWDSTGSLITDTIRNQRMRPAIAFYRNLLDDILKDLEEKGHSEGITAVNAAKDALRALDDVANRLYIILKATGPDGTEFLYYFREIDRSLKDYPELLKTFRDALEKVLPHVREDLEVEVNKMKVPLRLVIRELLEGLKDEVSGTKIPLEFVTTDLLDYRVEANWSLCNFPQDLNESALHVLRRYFWHDIDEASLSETMKNELDCLEKMITKVPEPHRAQLYEILRDVRTAFNSLAQKLKALRTSCARVIDDVERNRKSFSAAFSELNRMLSKAEKGLSDLKERISDLERVLPSSPPMKLCELLCFMFIAILAIHAFLHLAEDKDSRVKTRWNTALYSLAVAGTIMHQMWVLWGGGGTGMRMGQVMC